MLDQSEPLLGSSGSPAFRWLGWSESLSDVLTAMCAWGERDRLDLVRFRDFLQPLRCSFLGLAQLSSRLEDLRLNLPLTSCVSRDSLRDGIM